MKKLNLIGFFILAMVITIGFSCSNDSDSDVETKPDEKLLALHFNIPDFENYFLENYYAAIPSSQNAIKLIGYKTIYSKEDEIEEFKDLINNYPDTLAQLIHNYYSEDGKFMRIYCPLADAIVEIDGVEYQADENGLVYLNNIKVLSSSSLMTPVVIGRKQSENVVGTGSNIIKGDLIILANKLKSSSDANNSQNAYVYDLGERVLGEGSCHNEGDSELKGGGVSCYSNHRNRNCTTAFGLYQGRCTRQTVTCMDYNGWFTNCVNGKVANFPGSDCDYAMGRGQCWNELM